MLYVRQDPKYASEYITPLSANNGQTRLWGWRLKDYHTEPTQILNLLAF